MTLKRIALGFAATPPLPAALWAISQWRDHAVLGVAALSGTFLNVLPGAYLAMALVGLPADFDTFAMMPIGWPVDGFGPLTRRPLSEVVYVDTWGKPWPQ